MLHSFAETHIGQRNINEDNYFLGDDLNLYIVADGVGGMAKGEVASTMACEIITSSIEAGLGLKEAVEVAHNKIVDSIQNDQAKQGMATTVVAALFHNNQYEIAWVGDSRAYLWDDTLKLVTRDDSYVELLLEHGHINFDELETHPDRNVISQALGVEGKEIVVHSNAGTLQAGQILLLCTDGLYTIVNELTIIESIDVTHNVQEITHALVKEAVAKDGKDNITLLTIMSNINTPSQKGIIKPQVYREYDHATGKVIGFPSQVKSKSMLTSVDSKISPGNNIPTEYDHPTINDRNSLNTATNKLFDSQHLQTSHSLSPILFGAILLSLVVILINYFQS